MSTLMDTLQQRARAEVCICGKRLVVAYWRGSLQLRCGACGYNPETKLRDTRGLRRLYLDGENMSAIELQTLRQQLYKEINRAQCDGRVPNKRTVALFERVERTGKMGVSK